MNGPGDEFLAGAALAGDQDGGPGLGHPFDQGQDVLHDPGFSHNIGKTVFLVQFLVQQAIFDDQMTVLQGLGDGDQDLFIFKGLEDVIEGALFSWP